MIKTRECKNSARLTFCDQFNITQPAPRIIFQILTPAADKVLIEHNILDKQITQHGY